jgi:hypothetical protein
MKTKALTTSIAILAAIILLFTLIKNKKEDVSKVEESDIIMLFNGKDLSDWAFFLRDNSVDPATVFTVEDGIISIKGDPFGYMRTKEKYSDYILHVEWRWPVEPTNSGVFVHGQEPDAIWLQCIECQLQHGNAGDFICMSGADIKERTDKSRIVVRKMAESSEKPAGEWNTMEITCRGNTIEVVVNGILQNIGTESNISSGFICLQSEGKEIQFRNVYLTKLIK